MRLIGKALTFDDVLLIPAHSAILPRDTRLSTKLTRKIASTIGLVEFVPVLTEADIATPIASGYLPWRVLAQASGYVLVPAQQEGFAPGTFVPVNCAGLNGPPERPGGRPT